MKGGEVSLRGCRKFLDFFLREKTLLGRIRVPRFTNLASLFQSGDESLVNKGKAKVCTSCKGGPKALVSFYFKKTENRYEAICLDCKKKKVSARAKRRFANKKNLLKTGKRFIKCDFSDVSEKFDKGLSQSEFSLGELVSWLVN